MQLSALLSGAGIACVGTEQYEIEDIIYDSRRSAPRTVFVPQRGMNSDGHDYVMAAYNAGCRVFVCEHEVSLPDDAIVITVPDTAVALADLSACFFGFPAKKLKLIGVTGTKGKTTTSTLIYKVLNACGKRAGLIGTIGIYIGEDCYPTVNTTPESYKLQKYFAEMVDRGIEYAVMEVSSQAYLRSRVHGLEFDFGVFTNISPDHIGPGECRDFEHYRACKGELFAHSRVSVLNCDDPEFDYFRSCAAREVTTYGMEHPCDYRGSNYTIWKENYRFGIEFTVSRAGTDTTVRSITPGRYSVYNVLAVIAVCDACGVAMADMARVLPTCVVKGRFEIIDALPYCSIIIDFAHNEISLESVMRTIREYEPKRLVVLFGSVGNRSQLRRSAMARVANELADFAVLTSDNQNYEDPRKILADIEAAMDPSRCPYELIVDRTEAVEWALGHAQPGDVLLLAGKGHEDYELINGVREHFDEHEIIERVAAALLAAK